MKPDFEQFQIQNFFFFPLFLFCIVFLFEFEWGFLSKFGRFLGQLLLGYVSLWFLVIIYEL